MEAFLTMDLLHENSVHAIESLQRRFPMQKELFFLISNVFDPRYAFLVYAPLLYAFDRSSGKKLMWVSVLAEWSNQVLKWLLHGERPYWWVHETNVYNRTGIPVTPPIQQYFMTCETGPGSPSGHAMVSAAVWYVLFEALLKNTGRLHKNTRHLMSSVCWCVYALMILAVSLSRIYIAAHFPHQCVLGMIIGFSLAMHSDKLTAIVDRMDLRRYMLITGCLLATALGTFILLRSLGMNPMWSVDRAVKWCARSEYIHMDTTPFFSMMRYAGFLLGMGFGFHSVLLKTVDQVHFGAGMRLVTAILCLTLAKVSEKISLPKDNVTTFYGLAFLINALLPYLFVAVVPYLVTRCLGGKKMKVT